MNEISIETLNKMPEDSYELIDIRDEGLTLYGMIPGALHICLEELQSDRCDQIEAIPKEKKLVLYCEIGRKTRDMEELPSLRGRDCLSLEGGYIGYIRSGLLNENAQNEKRQKSRGKHPEKISQAALLAICKGMQDIPVNP